MENAVSYEVQRSIISNHIDVFLNGLKQLKIEGEQIASKLDDIEKLRMELRFLRTFVLFGNSNLDGFDSKMSRKLDKFEHQVRSLFYQDEDDNILSKYDMDHLSPRLLEDIKSYLSLKHDFVAMTKEEKTIEYWDSLLKNLHDLPKYCAKLFLPLMSEYKILRQVCRHLGDFYALIIKGCIAIKTTEYLYPRLQMTADRVTEFCFDHWCNEKLLFRYGTYQCSSKIASLFLEIIPVELEVLYICTTKLKESRSTELEGFVKQIIEASPRILQNYLILLQERMAGAVAVNAPTQSIYVMMEFLLIFYTDIPKRFIHRDKLNDMLAHVGVLTREISILVSKSSENMINEANFATSDFLQEVEQIKGDLRQMFLKAPKSSQRRFPMDDGLLFIKLLLRHLNDLPISSAYLVALMEKEIGMVKESLEFLRSYFGEVRQRMDHNGLLKDLWARALDVAYEAEHVINSILVRDNAISHLIFSLPSVTDKIKLIVAEVTSLQPEDKNGEPLDAKSSDEPIESTSSPFADVIVGLEEEEKSMIDQLFDEQSELDVISIVGMPGLGKTTLANKVYNNTLVASRFKVRAWCTVSQKYNKSKVLQKILNQVTGLNEKESGDDIAEKLRGVLYDRRYLIVLDDVWDVATGEMLIACFPKVERGNRIILTSRNSKIALQLKFHSDPFYLQLLTPEKSWELFEKKIFGEGNCPADLSDVGHQIIEKCQGLPLAVVLIAGVVVRMKGKKKDLWRKIQHNLDSFISGNNLQIMKVMQLSYDYLPDHLKPLLLYFGRSRKNKRTSISKLIQLLMAEGFVDHIPSKSSLEEATQSYLDALISSSLIMVSEEPVETSPFHIKIKVCYVHDVVHDFCSVKVEKEKFFKFINSGAPVHALDFLHRHLTIHTEGQLHKKCVVFNSSKSSGAASYKHLISLKVSGSLSPTNIRHIRQLRLLRVLQIGTIFVGDSFTDEIGLLVHLRFLKIWTKLDDLPRSWSNLQNLETLVMESGSANLVLLPRILELSKLRHVSITYCSLFGDEPLEEKSKSEDLTTLSHVEISYSEDDVGSSHDSFDKFPNLQHLECIINEPMVPPTNSNWFPKFDVLTKLESLFAHYFNEYLGYGDEESELIEPPIEYHFPTSLKELRLFRFTLTPALLSAIAALPELEILDLSTGELDNEKWDASEASFQSLKTLCLDHVNISEWHVDTETFPKLEELIIIECYLLKEIPSAFGDIDTLKTIRVAHINSDLGHLAIEIKDEVATITGEERLDVHISDEYYQIGEMNAQINMTKNPQGRRPWTIEQ